MEQATAKDIGTDSRQPPPVAVMQFTCATYYVAVGEPRMQIDIVRYGDCSRSASCRFRTHDASAKSGANYVAISQDMVFGAEETLQSVYIDIVKDGSWSDILEFEVTISNVIGAHLGRYLHRARVKVLNDSCWPTDKYREEILNDKIHLIPGIGLMFEYTKQICSQPLLRNDIIKQLMLGQLKNLYFFLTLYLSLYMVDVVMATGDVSDGREEKRDERDERYVKTSLVPEVLIFPGNRQRTAIAVALLYFLPFFFIYVIDQYRCFLSVPNLARQQLKVSMMQRFLNCPEDVRLRVKQSDLTMAMLRDVMEVVDLGFMKFLEVIRIVGKLSLALIFILAENRMATVPLVVYPIILSIWGQTRESITTKVIEDRARKQDQIANKVDEVVSNIRLISDFFLQESANDDFSSTAELYHAASANTASVAVTTAFLAPWLTVAFVSVFMALGATIVEGVGEGCTILGFEIKPISLGTFLATINVFKELGIELEEVFLEMMEIQMSFGPLRAITRLMNLKTDLHARMAINRLRRNEGKQQRELARRQYSQGQFGGQLSVRFPVDTVKIQMTNLCFSYKSLGLTVGKSITITQSFDQGLLYAFIGPARQGKATLLRRIGQVILPKEDEGSIFVPPHLRILHVDREICILRKTFLENLLLGETLERCGGLERLKAICLDCGLHEVTVDELESQEKALSHSAEMSIAGSDVVAEEKAEARRDALLWTSRLSKTDFARLNLARVFIMNPEVLAMHHPALAFDDRERPKIIKLLQTHVKEKGLHLPQTDLELRRPRTAFITSSFEADNRLVDKVFHISITHGMLPAEEAPHSIN
eukprot:TRINITY_DN2672_c0_g5_i1.p1 TRINITY_DN2672_c0_g5~~TRINITY_DN2672_c0_g5_i1.p1  ORF type:complete len:877 (-),score=125.12 TRINITY_DN2672_c0_g5_i1:91-2556(-)